MYHEWEKGQIVIAKAGHDKGELYVIEHKEEEYVYLVNGKNKTLEKPKKKKLKHVQKLDFIADTLSKENTKTSEIEDADYRKLLKQIKAKLIDNK